LTLANKITLSRMLMIPLLAAVFYIVFPGHDIVAAGVFVIAAATDYLDGKVARKRGEVTDLGKFLDPVADKVLAACALFFIIDKGMLVPVWGGLAAAVMIARELIISGLRQVAAVKGIVLAADKAGKAKTAVFNISVPVIMVSGYSVGIWYAGQALFFVAVSLSVFSGIRYLINNKKVFRD